MPIQSGHEAASALWRFTSEHRAGERDSQSFGQALADVVCDALGVPSATIWTIDDTEAQDCLRPLASSCKGGGVDTPLPIRWPNSAVLLAEIAHHSVVSCTDTAFAVLPLALQTMRLAAGTPKSLMVVGGYLNGLLVSLICVTSNDGPRRWSGGERRLLQKLSGQIVACVAHLSQAGVLRLVGRSLG